MKTYLVGGAVRDKLLGYPFHERDWVVVGSSPEEMLQLGYQTVGKDFPVFLHPKTKQEYALARTERKTAPGYTGFQFHTDPSVTLEDDLRRRDLTINAIAEDQQGNLVDPYGGQSDIIAKILRHVSPAFAEDPLRVLRVARFAARYHHLGFSIAPETMTLMRELASSGELKALTAERVWKETERALGEQSPDIYIRTLQDCGALKILMPEVDSLFGVPQRADYHPEIDTGLHILLSLQQITKLSEDSRLRFSVLMHDLGKATTPSDILPRHIGHEERGAPLVKAFCQRLKVPNNYCDLAVAVTRFHLMCHKAPTLKPKTIMKVLNGINAFRQPQMLTDFVVCCTADARGRTGFENITYPSGQWLLNVFERLQTVTAKVFVDDGITGKAIGEAIYDKRLKIIAQIKRDTASE